ncbi:Expansin-A16 [Vitis vinifera]|uniref:Expansin n=1 Tax=Vitis vinifera TaxID=29760 RepID=A0A438EKW2_VITVI|nr:Expansin-A16 [Vitis vinifera]
MSEAAFAEIAGLHADIVPVQYRRVKCHRNGGMRFTVSGNSHYYQVLITNVGLDGEVVAVKVKGSKQGGYPWQGTGDKSGNAILTLKDNLYLLSSLKLTIVDHEFVRAEALDLKGMLTHSFKVKSGMESGEER